MRKVENYSGLKVLGGKRRLGRKQVGAESERGERCKPRIGQINRRQITNQKNNHLKSY